MEHLLTSPPNVLHIFKKKKLMGLQILSRNNKVSYVLVRNQTCLSYHIGWTSTSLYEDAGIPFYAKALFRMGN
jgi:hypothetical protein